MEEHLPLRQILSSLFPSEGTDSVYFASRCIPGPRPETSTEQASDPALQLLLRPPPGFQAGARVVWGLHRDPLASPHNRPPFPGPKGAHPLSPRGAGREGRTPLRSGHSHGGILDSGAGGVGVGNSCSHSCTRLGSGLVEPAREPPTRPTPLRPVSSL